MGKILDKLKTVNTFTVIAFVLAINSLVLSISIQMNISARKSQPNTYTSTPSAVVRREEVFKKKLVPLGLEPGEKAESAYCKYVTEDGSSYYVVQPEGGDIVKVPFGESWLYMVSDSEECQLVKMAYEYTTEAGETGQAERYHIYSVGLEQPPHGDYTISAISAPAGYFRIIPS